MDARRIIEDLLSKHRYEIMEFCGNNNMRHTYLSNAMSTLSYSGGIQIEDVNYIEQTNNAISDLANADGLTRNKRDKMAATLLSILHGGNVSPKEIEELFSTIHDSDYANGRERIKNELNKGNDLRATPLNIMRGYDFGVLCKVSVLADAVRRFNRSHLYELDPLFENLGIHVNEDGRMSIVDSGYLKAFRDEGQVMEILREVEIEYNAIKAKEREQNSTRTTRTNNGEKPTYEEAIRNGRNKIEQLEDTLRRISAYDDEGRTKVQRQIQQIEEHMEEIKKQHDAGVNLVGDFKRAIIEVVGMVEIGNGFNQRIDTPKGSLEFARLPGPTVNGQPKFINCTSAGVQSLTGNADERNKPIIVITETGESYVVSRAEAPRLSALFEKEGIKIHTFDEDSRQEIEEGTPASITRTDSAARPAKPHLVGQALADAVSNAISLSDKDNNGVKRSEFIKGKYRIPWDYSKVDPNLGPLIVKPEFRTRTPNGDEFAQNELRYSREAWDLTYKKGDGSKKVSLYHIITDQNVTYYVTKKELLMLVQAGMPIEGITAVGYCNVLEDRSQEWEP